jgi:hypothetical protein
MKEKNKRLLQYCNNSITLVTIPKSGTNMLKLLFANYIAVHFEQRVEPITYDQMHTQVFYTGRQIQEIDGPEDLTRPMNILPKYTSYENLIHTHNHRSAKTF